MNEWIDESMNEWIDGWMGELIGGWMNEWMKRMRNRNTINKFGMH